MGKVLRVAILGLVLLLTSCMTTRNFSEIVKKELGDYATLSQKQLVPNVILKTDQLNGFDSALIVKKKKYYCIPAIVYWQQVNEIDCDINNKYFVNLFF